MDLELSGKRALITGASRGIGRAVARRMAAEGCNLVLVARDETLLSSLKAEISDQTPEIKVEWIGMDMRVPGACSLLADKAGSIDILVNNAGDVPTGTLLEIDEKRWRQAWDLKIFACINLCREVYRAMKEGGQGVIINIAGTAGERPRSANIAISSGNAALIGFSRGLGRDSVFDGIRVVAVNPGATQTDRQLERLKQRALLEFGDQERWRECIKHYPFGRMGEPGEIADVVTFLASPRASYVSGTSVTVDAGGAAE